jgi:hypothetical protein
MKSTISATLCACGLFACALAASAQTNYTFSGTCPKAAFQQSIPAGDAAGHSFGVARGTCSTNDRIGGAAAKAGAWSEIQEITSRRMKTRGVYVETFDGGDKVFYDYRQTWLIANGTMQSAKGEFKAIGGTGKMQGIKAKGHCTFTPEANDAATYSCSGDYTLGAASAAP